MLNPRFCLFVSRWLASGGLKLPSSTLFRAPGLEVARRRRSGEVPVSRYQPEVFPLNAFTRGLGGGVGDDSPLQNGCEESSGVWTPPAVGGAIM